MLMNPKRIRNIKFLQEVGPYYMNMDTQQEPKQNFHRVGSNLKIVTAEIKTVEKTET